MYSIVILGRINGMGGREEGQSLATVSLNPVISANDYMMVMQHPFSVLCPNSIVSRDWSSAHVHVTTPSDTIKTR